MDVFDVLILGTGLSESILAAALAKNGIRVLQFDSNQHYGSSQATLSPSELSSLLSQSTSSTHHIRGTIRGQIPNYEKAFCLPLAPSLQPASTALINALVQSGVSKYTAFGLLDDSFIYSDSGDWLPVPTSKSSIFSAPAQVLPLPQKRKLMKFLQCLLAVPPSDNESLEKSLSELPEVLGKERMGILQYLTSSWGLREDVARSVIYALGFCDSDTDLTLPTLVRMAIHLHSAGRYGDSPFLVGHYGGFGEIVQGFCRMAAVHGAVYVLGHQIQDLSFAAPNLNEDCGEERIWKLTLEGIDEPFQAKILICSPSQLPASAPIYKRAFSGSASGKIGDVKEMVGDGGEEVMAVAVAIYKIDSDPFAVPIISSESNLPSSHTEGEGEQYSTESSQPAKEGTDSKGETSIFDSHKSSLRIFPPGSSSSTHGHDRAVYVLLTGADTLASPSSHVIAQFQTRVRLRDGDEPRGEGEGDEELAERVLGPFLRKLSSNEPIYSVFLIDSSPSSSKSRPFSPTDGPESKAHQSFIPINSPPNSTFSLPSIGDGLSDEATRTFWEVWRLLRHEDEETESEGMWPPREEADGDELS